MIRETRFQLKSMMRIFGVSSSIIGKGYEVIEWTRTIKKMKERHPQ